MWKRKEGGVFEKEETGGGRGEGGDATGKRPGRGLEIWGKARPAQEGNPGNSEVSPW